MAVPFLVPPLGAGSSCAVAWSIAPMQRQFQSELTTCALLEPAEVPAHNLEVPRMVTVDPP